MTSPSAADGGDARYDFKKSSFDVNLYVKRVLREYNRSTELVVEKLAAMSEDSASKMKQAIFENYKLFIKAGKTASILEATMHQIHSDFAEKQQIMNALAQMSLFNEALPNIDRPSKSRSIATPKSPTKESIGSPLSTIFSYIEGASQALSSDLSRRVLHYGEVSELSADAQSFISSARLVLLNDVLVVAYKKPGKTNQSGFRIQAVYSLENVELGTILPKERRHMPPNAFKLTIMKTPRLFQTDSAESKQEWMLTIEQAKSACAQVSPSQLDAKAPFSPTDSSHLSPSSPENPSTMPAFAIPPNRASVSAVRDSCKALAATLPECVDMLTPPPSADEPSKTEANGERKNPFADARDATSAESESGIPGWLRSMPEDLDVAISERDFTRATELVIRAHRTWEHQQALSSGSGVKGRYPQTQADLEQLAARIHQMEENLTEILQQELITAAERHGASKAVASAVLNLYRLGKATLAAQLFLVYRSSLIAKALTRGIRQEGNQVHYLNRLSFTFHRHLAETLSGWRKSVVQPLVQQSGDQPDGLQTPLSSEAEVKAFEQLLSVRFCSWVLEEAQKFGDQLRGLLVDTRSISFSTLALVSQRVTAHAEKMTSILGIDILSIIQGRLLPTWKKAAETQSNILKDTAENRAQEETWEPASGDQAQEQEKELLELGLLKRSSRAGTQLTTGSYQFIRSLCSFIQGYRRLQCEDLEPTMNRCVNAILQAELQNYQDSLSNPAFAPQRAVIMSNLDFLVQRVLPKWMKPLNGMRYASTRNIIRSYKELVAQLPTESTDSANTSSL